MSKYQFPDDEFDATDDDGPVPVGVHRAQVPAWRSWIPLLAVIVIVPLLAWGAVALLGSGNSARKGGTTAGSTEAAPTAEAPTVGATPTQGAGPTQEPPDDADLTLGITVHNGTTVTGLAGRTRDRLENAGFTAVSVPGGVYDSDEPASTTVFYASEEQAATARMVAQTLGVDAVVESPEEAASNPIVVVLRDDYQE